MNHRVEIRARSAAHLSPDSGARVVQASAESAILDAALDAGVPLSYGCRNAICRACEARILEGRVSYPSGAPAALAAGEIAAGKVLLCQARAETDLVVEVDDLVLSGPRTLPCRVIEKSWLSHDVLQLRLALRDGDHLNARAGQYVDLVLRDGRRRAFSVASAPANFPQARQELELQLRIVPGGEFSSHAAANLKERALLRIHGPLGGFYLRDDVRRPVILIAGGTGFAPIKAIIEDVLATSQGPSEIDPPMHLYWGVRGRRDLYQAELVDSWVASHVNFQFTPVLSAPDPGDEWEGRQGLVHEAVLDDYDDLDGYAVYVSGPPVMVDAVRTTFPAAGANLDHIFADSFDYAYVTGHDRTA